MHNTVLHSVTKSKKSIRASHLYKQCLKLHGGMFCDTPNFKSGYALFWIWKFKRFTKPKQSSYFSPLPLAKDLPENQFLTFWVEKKQVKLSVLPLNLSVLASRSLKPKLFCTLTHWSLFSLYLFNLFQAVHAWGDEYLYFKCFLSSWLADRETGISDCNNLNKQTMNNCLALCGRAL